MKIRSVVQGALVVATVVNGAFIVPDLVQRQTTVDSTAGNATSTAEAEAAAKAKAAADLLASMPTCGVSAVCRSENGCMTVTDYHHQAQLPCWIDRRLAMRLDGHRM